MESTKKLFDGTAYQHEVFETILFLTSEEGMKPIPNGEAEILLEMAAALVEYLGGDVSNIPDSNAIAFDASWTQRVNSEVKLVLERNSKHLNPALLQTLCDLLKVKWKHDHGSWWESNIRYCLMSRQRALGNTFFLVVPAAQRIRENIKKVMDSDTVEHCKQIGILMRKYIERDLQNTK